MSELINVYGDYVLSALLGMLWFFLTGVQTRLLVKTKSEMFLMGWAFGTSLVWGYLIRTITIAPYTIIPYALGTAIGAYLARQVGKRLTA